MDRRNSNLRGRVQWRLKATTKNNSHNFASGMTADWPCETPSSGKDEVSKSNSLGETLNQSGHVNAPKSQYRKIRNSPTSSGGEKLDLVNDAAGANSYSQIASSNKGDVSSYENSPSEARLRDNNSKQLNHMNTFKDQCTTSPSSNANIINTPTKEDIQSQQASQKEIESESSDNLNCQSSGVSYDICRPRKEDVKTLNPSLFKMNKWKRDEAKRSIEGKKIIELRSGMVLLQKFISYDDQVKIVNKIRDLGVDVGGFYEPSYRDGGKLHLKMMCLGKNWDPWKREYGDKRQTDDSKPPLLPYSFHQLVKGAIEASHSFLRERATSLDVKRVLPLMSPTICIVNFYTKSGQLGLHQDKDESKESLHRQLPVVSFSIGDSAEFLYGDEKDPEKANKVVLESGDVLIFGGKSRLVYHGVASIKSDTAPEALLEETRLRPGRLNLTFREF